jgi:hypothetical protein
MIKKYAYFALSAGAFASLVTVIYSLAYENATKIEGEQLESLRGALPMANLIMAPFIVCILATLGYFLARKYLPRIGPFLFYFVFSAVSILTSFGIFTVYGLHEEIMYTVYGYAMPMHFFPFLSWVTFKALFFPEQK